MLIYSTCRHAWCIITMLIYSTCRPAWCIITTLIYSTSTCNPAWSISLQYQKYLFALVAMTNCLYCNILLLSSLPAVISLAATTPHWFPSCMQETPKRDKTQKFIWKSGINSTEILTLWFGLRGQDQSSIMYFLISAFDICQAGHIKVDPPRLHWAKGKHKKLGN